MSTTMQIQREELNPCTIKLSVACTKEQVSGGFDKAYKKFAKQIRVPGFRPGHAPKNVVSKFVDPNDLMNAAAEEIVRKAMNEALKEESIKPHDSPAVELTVLSEEESKCEFTAKIPLEPKVELGSYKGVVVKRPKIEVTDEEVTTQLDELRKRAGKREAVTDRGIHEGDIAVVNIKVEGEDGDGRNFMSIAGQTFKQLDEAITGMQVEEIKKVELSFPKTFQEKEWAGKKKKAQITIRSVSSVAMPELDDEFAKKAGKELKAKDLAELKDKLKENILEAKKAMSQEFTNEAILEELMKSSTVHVPDTMWEAVANQRLREEAQKAAQEGKKLEDVAKESGMEFEEFVSNWQNEAKVQVQRAVIANTIFKTEGMKLTNQDMNDSLVEMAQEYGVHPAQIIDFMRKNKNFTELEVRTVYKKVMTFLNENAKIEEV
ncbi:MAG: trigger factor [Armatimonadetes bacterium]|nr:trigger factor [Armatimonadota bacterium]